MVFNTPIFFVFFIVFLIFYGLIFVQKTPRLYFILIAGLVFYGAWNYRFIPLLIGSSIVDYYLALAIGGASSLQRKKQYLTLSIVMNIGILGLFKYADFALESVADFLLVFGVEASLPTLAWVLPVGISFYTFQSLSYTIDVYRGDMEPRKGLVHFTTALAFFPQLVAGPILRARQILPQFHSLPIPTWENARHGMLLVTSGLAKKTIADHQALWDKTAQAIKASDKYDGLILKAQLGLIPLGIDPKSGLHEFLHLESHEGPLPERDKNGHIPMTGETGIILVLIPKGKFWMGSHICSRILET